MGARPGVAWTLTRFAESLLKRREPGDAERACVHLEEATALTAELNMSALARRVSSLMNGADGSVRE
jgi:hypothetical protein